MVFKFAKQYLDGKNLSQKEREKVFSEMVKRQDNIDRHERDYFHRMERPSTEEELEKIIPRIREPVLSLAERKNVFKEVICGLTPGAACQEASRCLRCDLERAESIAASKGS